MTETAEGEVSSKPRYKKEFSIFENETLEKLKNFSAARSNWITSNANQAINIDTDKGFYKSTEYKARWAFFRRKWFLTFLHAHWKTLRPPRYYTLKQKLSILSSTEVKKPKESLISRKKCENAKRSREDQLEMEKRKKKKKTEKKRGNIDDFLGAFYPSKKAITKLKAAKLENRMIESCRCDDGKELTVVIKGVCLCDKTNLNKFKLDKVCDEFTKLENKNAELTNSTYVQAKDSLEVIKKRLSRYSMAKKGDEEEEKTSDEESSSTKKIKFVNDQSVSEGNKTKTEKTHKCRPKSGHKSKKYERPSVELVNSTDHEVKINKNRLEEKPDPSKTDLIKSSSQTSLERHEKSSSDLDETVKNNGRNDSTITLYKNREKQDSNIGLTKEQSEKMKKT